MTERPQRWSVTLQHRWQDREPVVAIAIGGWESTGPGLVEILLQETVDPREAVEVAIATAQERALAIDLESAVTYGDWPDATAEGTGYGAEELRAQAQLWAECQPTCDECLAVATLELYTESLTGTQGNYCSDSCAERACDRYWQWLREEDPEIARYLEEEEQ